MKLLKVVHSKEHNMLRICFEDGGEVPADIAKKRFNSVFQAERYAEKKNKERALAFKEKAKEIVVEEPVVEDIITAPPSKAKNAKGKK